MAIRVVDLRRQTPPKNDMTISKEIIELAVAGRWYSNFLDPEKLPPCSWSFDGEYFVITGENSLLIRKCLAEIALDSTFWQALGKALGWTKWGEFDEEYKKSSDPQWQYNAHRFYDLILTNSDTTAFWQEILTNPTHN